MVDRELIMEDKFILLRRDGKELEYDSSSVWIKELVKIDAAMALAPIDEEAVEKINNDFYKELRLLSKKLGRQRFESREWHNCIKTALSGYPEISDVFLFATKEINASIYEHMMVTEAMAVWIAVWYQVSVHL